MVDRYDMYDRYGVKSLASFLQPSGSIRGVWWVGFSGGYSVFLVGGSGMASEREAVSPDLRGGRWFLRTSAHQPLSLL